MKKVLAAAGLVMLATSTMGCSYGAVAVMGDKVIVARNDGLLFGALRKIYTCTAGADAWTCTEVKGAP
jgi:hypothetical protein